MDEIDLNLLKWVLNILRANFETSKWSGDDLFYLRRIKYLTVEKDNISRTKKKPEAAHE